MNMIPCYFNQKMIADCHVDHLQKCESVLEALFQLKRDGKFKFLSNREKFCMDTDYWKVLQRQVVAIDRTDNLVSLKSDSPIK